MKILRIGILNLNSLRGQHTIDFTEPPLADHPLYAIVGPTGAGKTTILDAITLALYGQTERTKSLTDLKKEVATVMTHGTAQCHAEVEYETTAGRFRSVWRRRRAHKKAHKDLQDSRRELSRWNSTTGVYDILATKKREVDQLTEEYTGLSYDRFVRSVMLTQGAFDRFLKSDTGEKAAILEQITGTEVYRQLSEGAFRRYKLAREAHDRVAESLTHLMPLPTEQRQQLDDQLADLQAIAAQLQDRQALYAAQLAAYFTAAKLAEQRDGAVLHSQRSEAGWQGLTEQRKQLKRNDELTPLRSDLDRLHLLRAELAQLNQQHERVTGQLTPATAALAAATTSNDVADRRLQQFTDREPEREQRLCDAEVLEAGLHTLTQREESTSSDLAQHLRSRNILLAERDALREEITALERRLNGLTEVQLTTELDALEAELPLLEKQTVVAADQLKYLTVQEKIAGETQVQTDLNERLDRAKHRHTELALQLKLAEQAVDLAQERRQNALLRASLEEHRQALQDGKPCPLCGAEHHPYLHDGTEVSATPDQLQQRVVELDNVRVKMDNAVFALTQQINTMSTQLAGSSRVLEERREQLRVLGGPPDLDRAQLTTRQSGVRRQLEEGSQRLEQLRQLRPLLPQLQIKRAALVDKEASLTTLREQTTTLEASLGRIRVGITEHRRQLTTLLHPHDTSAAFRRHQQQLAAQLRQQCSQRQGEFQRLSTEVAKVQERQQSVVQQLERQRTEHATVKTNLTQRLAPLELTIERAREQLLNPARVLALREQIQTAQQDRKTSHALAKQATNEHAIAAAALQDLPPEAVLRREQAHTSDDLTQVEREIGALQQRRTEDERRIKEVAHRRTELEALARERDRWARMNELIGSADGKKFRSFAQSITLQRLVAIGNRHLETINPRYQMSYAPPPPGGKETLDLEIIDNYMNDNRRTMETLSGGETFLMSLALALGLSDLARGKQLIQSLFIDEGFGTLDGKTLDQAMATLEQLQAQGKTIGIISHVQQLRERIHCQIQLEPLGDGFSRVQLSS